MHNATNRYIIFKIIIANLKDTTIQHQSVYCFYIKTTEKKILVGDYFGKEGYMSIKL